MSQKINIENRQIFREYEIIERYTAGIQLLGTEIKSIRQGKVSLGDSWCHFRQGELYVKGMQIVPYALGTHTNHVPDRERKLLLNRQELNKLEKKVKERGFTIVVIRIYIAENNLAKLVIALARGKAVHDKRRTIKERDLDREMGRQIKLHQT